MDLRTLLADQMGNFTPYDVPGLLFGIGLAALAAYIMGGIARVQGRDRVAMAGIAAITALAVSLVRTSVPLSVALVAVMILARPAVGDRSWSSSMPGIAALCIGLGCGASAALITLIGMVPISLLLRWASAGRSDRSA